MFAVVIALVAVGCGASVASPSVTPAPSTGSAAPSATASPSIIQSPGPSASPEPTVSEEPGGSATPEPTVSSSPSGPDAAAATCTGKPDTKDFFVAIAEAVQWNVYCAVLPAGWSVDSGVYHLARGGDLTISYKTATGGHLELREGHQCTDSPSACTPNSADIGPANLGDQAGELMALDGGFVLYVDAGQNPSWTATATGIDEATFRQLCAAATLVKA